MGAAACSGPPSWADSIPARAWGLRAAVDTAEGLPCIPAYGAAADMKSLGAWTVGPAVEPGMLRMLLGGVVTLEAGVPVDLIDAPPELSLLLSAGAGGGFFESARSFASNGLTVPCCLAEKPIPEASIAITATPATTTASFL